MAEFINIKLNPKRSTRLYKQELKSFGWLLVLGVVAVKTAYSWKYYGALTTGLGEQQIHDDMGILDKVDNFVDEHYN